MFKKTSGTSIKSWSVFREVETVHLKYNTAIAVPLRLYWFLERASDNQSKPTFTFHSASTVQFNT